MADVFPIDRLATESAGAVSATVSEVRSYWTADHTTIESEVTLTGVTRITRDGSAEIADITFTVVGGTVGDATMRVSCIPEFRPGDRWVMFLQTEYRQFPVLGMERGMFRIVEVDGVDRIASPDGAAVTGINAEGRFTRGEPVEARPVSAEVPTPKSTRGGIAGVRAIERTEAALAGRGAAPAALTVDAFLDVIRHHLPALRADDTGPIAPARVRPIMAPVQPKSIHEVRGVEEAAQ